MAPLDNGLVMELLRYPTELRDPTDYFDEVPKEKPAADMLKLATQLIEQKTRKFEPEKFQDHYATALKELVQDKIKGKIIIATAEPTRPSGANVVDLMAALKKSLAGKQDDPRSQSKERVEAARSPRNQSSIESVSKSQR